MGIVSSYSKTRSLKEKASSLPYLSVVVREERIKLGLKQTELASKVGIGLKTLRKIEQGDLNVNFLRLNYLLNCLGLYMKPTELVVSPSKKSKRILSRDNILQVLKNIYQIFEIKYGVCELALFGSYAKGLENSKSDIDILIDFNKPVTLELEGEIQLILENLFQGTKIDLTLKKNLQPDFKKEIEETKINANPKL